MKKILLLFSAIILATSIKGAAVTSHTFFSARPHYQKASPERVSLFRNDLLDAPCCNSWGGAFQTAIYGSRTTRDEGSKKLVKFFLPQTGNACCLNVQEYNAPVEEAINDTNRASSADYDRNKDIEARHFNIVTNGGTGENDSGPFSSKACFSAEQSKIGIGFTYKQRLSCKCDGSTGFWFEASFPVEGIKNKICINEEILNDGGGPLAEEGLDESPHVGSLKDAFKQENWRFGKIEDNKRQDDRKWDVADIELLVGYNTYNGECARLGSYCGFVAPTGTRVRGRRLFEPIVGNNRHWGITFGSTLGFRVFQRCSWDIQWLLDMNTRYLFENEEVRSFDLIGKPWGRYMEVYSSPEQASQAFQNSELFSGTSGINVFTQCVKVKPRFQGTFNQALLFTKYCDCWTYLFEAGYNLFARQEESVKLRNTNFLNGVTLKGVDGLGSATTARNIKANFRDSSVLFSDPNLDNLRLSERDIDLSSAAHPAVVSHTIYGTLGLRWEKNCPCFAGIGGSFEFQSDEINTALERWTIWAKAGLTF